MFLIYESNPDVKDPFVLVRTFTLGDKETVQSISLSPSGAVACVQMKSNQIVKFPIGLYDAIGDGEVDFKYIVEGGIHHSYVTSMASCIHKPIVITSSADKMIKVWNYLTWKCELSYSMPDEATSLSLHPSGFQLAVGSREKVRLFNLFADNMKHFADLGVKACRQLQYSHGGQYIAVCAGLNVLVYDTYTVTCIANFKDSTHG